MNVLLSIKPEYAEKILTGEKRYEFRKTPFSQADTGDRVVLYASSPDQQLVGQFTIGQVIEGSPRELWSRFQDYSGIKDSQRFFDYFDGNEIGYAVTVSEPRRYEAPIDPYKQLDEFHPPVSFKYVNGQLSVTLSENERKSVGQASKPACD